MQYLLSTTNQTAAMLKEKIEDILNLFVMHYEDSNGFFALNPNMSITPPMTKCLAEVGAGNIGARVSITGEPYIAIYY